MSISYVFLFFCQFLLDAAQENLHNTQMIERMKTFQLVLSSVIQIAPYVKHFVFRCEHFSYLAGQFITIHFPVQTEAGEKILRRSYSVATTPEKFKETGCIEFAAGYVKNGPASELLFHLNPGDTLQASGPFGRLILKEEMPKRYIFVATSTGITPFRAMLTVLAERLKEHPTLEIVLLEGVQYQRDALYAEDFLAFVAQYPQCQFYLCYSREITTDNLQSYERLGYVQALFSTLNLDAQSDAVYLCGNPGMIDNAFSLLKEQYCFDVKNIFREKYISSK